MLVLVINAGSSSVKYRLLDMQDEEPLSWGLVEKIGEPMGQVFHQGRTSNGVHQFTEKLPIRNHRQAMERVVNLLTTKEGGVIDGLERIDAIGHRVVHGGERFRHPVPIDADVVEGIREHIPLAPLHNPGHLAGIETALELFPGVPQVAVFDTAFHQTIPPAAYFYAVPHRLYQDLGVRRYGFHGISHAFVTRQASHLLNIPLEKVNLITLHLGNGASITAVKGGCSVDTSMGLTPLEGVIMGTRSGSLDPAVVGYLHRQAGMDVEEIMNLLTRESGLLGICGHNDLRDIHRRRLQGDERAQLALDMLVYSYRKYVGAYMAVLGRTDALVFTGGIGENDAVVRELVCRNLENMGVCLDPTENLQWEGRPKCISRSDSRVRVLVIPTNEELEIARQTLQVLSAPDSCGACAQAL
ncbi:acetate kinase [Desulfacinum hydrothermale DSM 13146]|uniref:Acetate kinase n=1 Tax=Desulfacinum hydrothermale DSM 13146 TaxID=1121390 RepID=A0A1W1XLD4_9BACT|nr:acetate kinase [Desulfacinum hydrothermale]SMC24672.1 acetate kinase [Desulfacinum hydrothermale DSM 13146]